MKSTLLLFATIAVLACSALSNRCDAQEDILFDDFESGAYGKWTISVEAFGGRACIGDAARSDRSTENL
ncbi:hypothetical protein [Stieleria varia]|uniref:hypothetical protein n=1 Tax=Stieleria varia TaxID=2528005 RepID=UPI0011B35DD3|nr:hypothetical protein [Stieleria varia]